jgi:CRP-like cAMP-binding protein
MKIHRYEFVGPDSLVRLNDLLAHGWSPVREICGVAADGSGNTLVLLEKEADVLQFPGDALIEGVPLEFLMDVMLFENFTTEEIRQVVSLCRITTLSRGAKIFSNGDPAESLYVVLVGDVEVLLPELPVEETTVVLLNPGGVFGESTFFSETPHTMSASCASDSVTLLSLNRVAFNEIFQTNSAVALRLVNNVARILAARLQETDQWVWNLLQQSQFARVSTSWRRFRHRVGGTESGGGGFFGI